MGSNMNLDTGNGVSFKEEELDIIKTKAITFRQFVIIEFGHYRRFQTFK
jgi:hypothetical protein